MKSPQQERRIFRRGIDCFNRRDFFTSHEVLEEIWLEASPEEKPFYQGLIQAAAAFHHYRRGNPRGARSLLERGVEKLRRYPQDHHRIDLGRLLRRLEGWLERLGRGEPTQSLPLPKIRPARRRPKSSTSRRPPAPRSTSLSSSGGRSRRKPNS